MFDTRASNVQVFEHDARVLTGNGEEVLKERDVGLSSPSQPQRPTVRSDPNGRTGRWTPDEKILFLYGLKRFGKGRWKKMSVYLPHRSLVQIKSHAQKVLKRLEAGENVFRRLEENYSVIDSLIVQAAKQRDSLLNSPSPSTISTVVKRKRAPKKSSPNSSMSSQYNNQVWGENRTVDAESGTTAVIAAAALCQLSSFSGGWDQGKVQGSQSLQESF